MRFTIALLLCVTGNFQTLTAQSPSFSQVDAFLQQHVRDGRVDYAAIAADPQEMRALASAYESADLAAFPEPASRMAFWLNAYNVLVIKGVVDAWPISSPMEVPGFFDRKTYTVAGKEYTLNQIEHEIVRPTYQDARIHFVLVCAAVSCPILTPVAFTPANLEAELESRTHDAINEDIHVSLNGNALQLTEIFRWYTSDFDADGGVVAFINKYRTQKVPENASISYATYNWQLNAIASPSARQHGLLRDSDNLQNYTPSTLLRPGEYEIKQFNNLYTQTAFFNDEGDRRDAGRRETYFTGITNFQMGFRKNLNIGVDLYFKSVRVGGESSSRYSVLQFEDGPLARTALASIGPKIKFNPLPSVGSLALQTTLIIPVADDLQGRRNGRPFLDWDATQFWTQIFYDRLLSQRWLIYFESGWFVRFQEEGNSLESPFKAILNYYPSRNWTFYATSEIAPTWNSEDLVGWSAYYTQFGAGAKFQLTPAIELETLYTVFPLGKNKGAGSTVNLGFRIII